MANDGVLVGAYYGLRGNHLPSPIKVASLCLEQKIRRIRLSEPNKEVIEAFHRQGIDISFGIPNTVTAEMARNDSAVIDWFNTILKPNVKIINFNYIVVGQEADENVLPAMKAVQKVLNDHSLGRVKLTTLISYNSTLAIKDFPSSGTFDPRLTENLKGIINFLREQGSPLMVDVYPYMKYAYPNPNDDFITSSFATFGDVTEPVRDGPFSYYNLFDFMLDTFYVAIEKLRVGDVSLVVGETGWPTSGHQDKATVALAAQYNQRFVAHITSGVGTPRRPNLFLEGYIRSMFDEDSNPQGETQFFGFFNENNLSPIYPLFN